MDGPASKVYVLPFQPKDFACTQATKRADGISHVERLGQIQVDAPNVLELFDERRGARIMCRPEESPR